jgi:glucose/arabinose dehydrogenase
VRTALGVVLAVVMLALPAAADAERLVRVAGDFRSPVHATAERGSLFVVEQRGMIWQLNRDGRSLFLDIRGEVLCCGERGLFSVEFDAEYGANRFFYVNYTDNGGDIVFARFRANSRFTRGVVSSKTPLITVEHSAAHSHNGGQIVWGPDGRLHMSTGDGGGGCDAEGDAQNTAATNWLGKIFSMDPRDLTAAPRLEAYGLRNPWRFSFDRETGRLYVGDVGQSAWEEVNTQSARTLSEEIKNYGWNVYEGFDLAPCGNPTLGGPSPHRPPIAVYSHARGCSITGGFAYRGRALGHLAGWYFFGDFCTGRIWRLLWRNGELVSGRQLVLKTGLNITSFGENSYGDLLVVDRTGGTVYRLAP